MLKPTMAEGSRFNRSAAAGLARRMTPSRLTAMMPTDAAPRIWMVWAESAAESDGAYSGRSAGAWGLAAPWRGLAALRDPFRAGRRDAAFLVFFAMPLWCPRATTPRTNRRNNLRFTR